MDAYTAHTHTHTATCGDRMMQSRLVRVDFPKKNLVIFSVLSLCCSSLCERAQRWWCSGRFNLIRRLVSCTGFYFPRSRRRHPKTLCCDSNRVSFYFPSFRADTAAAAAVVATIFRFVDSFFFIHRRRRRRSSLFHF